MIEKVIRGRILDSQYWKETCFVLNAASLVKEAAGLKSIGGLYDHHPSEFLCLLHRLFEIRPDQQIVLQYLNVPQFKYLRALALFYIRMTFDSVDVYSILERQYADIKRLRYRDTNGYSLMYMDQLVYLLLNQERVFDCILPRLTQRHVLEKMGRLQEFVSPIERQVDGKGEERDEAEDEAQIEIEIDEMKDLDAIQRYISESDETGDESGD